MTLFTQKVKSVVANIPRGRVLSYKAVAAKAGQPGAARAVGTIMRANLDPDIPCHRVINSDNSLGGYNGLRGEKEALLRSEGHVIKNKRILIK